ncbi:MAG: cobyrinate a,c-diamide synthase [Roseburia sp.]|nr:cobyrinate a,c-diamide synthase [Roseburia sp.]
MDYKRVMIAAPKSGSGKTLAVCALLQALVQKGYQTVSYKCGPDYIDPLFHEKVLGVPARNLDTFFTDEKQTRELFIKGTDKDALAVLEGVMGLYDGLGGVREEGSSYHLAKVTKTPVILVVDGKGMGRSVIPLLAGFLAYDTEHLIKGVILNKISAGYFETVKPLIEEELDLPVLGFLPEKKEFCIESRHLGLVLPDELENVKEKLQELAKAFVQTVSLGKIMETAAGAEKIKETAAGAKKIEEEKSTQDKENVSKACPVIAVAKDEAFCFYYADNLRLLEEYGADIQYFSPLHDESLPGECHALLLGGGYPELYARELSCNQSMREAVREAAERGMPVVAECGGFLYLHSTLTGKDGISYDMAGVVPGRCFDTGKSVRFGYIEMQEKRSVFLPAGERIKGHEFHYYDSTTCGEDIIASKPVTGKQYSCIIESENRWIGFPHLYYPSNPAFARSFVEKAARYQQQTLHFS